MLGAIERYTSTRRSRRTGSLGRRVARILVIAFVAYILVTHFFISTARIDSVSMRPGLAPRQRVIVNTLVYGAWVPFTHVRLPGFTRPQRGDIVVVRSPFSENDGALRRLFEPILRFFTLQKATLSHDLFGERINGFMVKRVIGLPGDTLVLDNFTASVKPRDARDFVPENELIHARYRLSTAFSPRGWKTDLPFSGTSEEIVLKDDQYFVLGDNRPESSDSRSWGPVSASRIVAKVILSYWPPRSIGKP